MPVPPRERKEDPKAVLEKVIVAGFGGQGVMFLGRLLAQAVMHDGKNVSFFPSYGPEVRGGRANCHVIVSSDEIFSPMIAHADSLVAMSQLSWDFFSPRLKPEGMAVVNASMVRPANASPSLRLIPVPATEAASEMGDVRVTNMIMLGAYNRVRGLLPLDALLEHLRAALGGRKADLFELNRQAIQRGIQAAEEFLSRPR